MKIIVYLKKFFVRYVNTALNDNAYRNFLRNTYRKRQELKFDLAELENLYRRKEREKKKELRKNISELQEKMDKMQAEYDERNKRDYERLYEEFTDRRQYFDNMSEAFLIKLEELDMKRIALEKEIVVLEERVSNRKSELEEIEQRIQIATKQEKKHHFFSWGKNKKNSDDKKTSKNNKVVNKKNAKSKKSKKGQKSKVVKHK